MIGRRSSIAGIHSELRRTNFTLHFTAEDEATCGGIAAGLPYGLPYAMPPYALHPIVGPCGLSAPCAKDTADLPKHTINLQAVEP